MDTSHPFQHCFEESVGHQGGGYFLTYLLVQLCLLGHIKYNKICSSYRQECHDFLEYMLRGHVPWVEVDLPEWWCSVKVCQDRFSSTILLGGPGMQGTNEEVSPDTSRC